MKIGIVGSGLVGSTIAYAVLFRKAASEIIMIDVNEQRARAEAMDIAHAVPFSHPAIVRQGGFSDLKECVIVVVAAGVNQKPGETRIQLLGRNGAIFEKIIPEILFYAPEATLLVATNPVDIMTHIAGIFVKKSGKPVHQVVGTGTTLDTARFRSLLGTLCHVDPQHVHGYVIGEHGDSEVLTWSVVDVGGFQLEAFLKRRDIPFDEKVKNDIDGQVRNAAYTIIEGKGATYYGIGAAAAHIVNAFTHNSRAILTVCSYLENVRGITDVTLSLPHLLQGSKVVDILPLNLSSREEEALRTSAGKLRSILDEYQAL
ncbi:MAG: L-lactate dehydrogenase [Chlorobi bacterium]|nr:L-lactate dehydrogenase [Chlorobiota bacterium]